MNVPDLNQRKRKFIKFLSKVFTPLHFDNKNITLVEFPDFIDFVVNEKASKPFYQPGVYAIHCFGTNSTLITPSRLIRPEMIQDFRELNHNSFEFPEKLQKDFCKYPDECFIFIIFCAGPEWLDFDIRDQEVDRISRVWPYALYES